MKKLILFLLLLPLAAMAQEVKTSEDSDTTLIVLDILPEYPGGMNAFAKDMYGNLRYPVQAIDKGSTGQVIVQFVVEKDGSLSHIKVVKDEVGYGAGEEVVRVMKTLKNFEPGQKDGKTVRCKYQLPVKFELYDDPPTKKAKKNKRNK